MIQYFKCWGTQDIFYGVSSKDARKACPRKLRPIAARILDLLDSAEDFGDIKARSEDKLEKLTGDRAGQYSIRINQQYRICFEWNDPGPFSVEIVDYH
ncbi:MAG: type II toxin-antitoxin system RelE/ParE family toxin [Cyanobacteria bacterium P01_E01_bin.34]